MVVLGCRSLVLEIKFIIGISSTVLVGLVSILSNVTEVKNKLQWYDICQHGLPLGLNSILQLLGGHQKPDKNGTGIENQQVRV